MSSYYGVIVPGYWTGDTGRRLRERGGKDAQLLGVYLLSNSYMNMLGLYSVKLKVIEEELILSAASVHRAFAVMEDEKYAFYDEDNAVVWVREMARFRLNIEGDEPLSREDKRVIGAQRLYATLPSNKFLGAFYDRYGKVLRLKRRREATPLDLAPSKESASGSEGASKGLERGFEASNRSESGTGTDQSTSSAAGAAPRARVSTTTPASNVGVITRLAHEAIDLLGIKANGSDLAETIKTRCAQLHIAYDSLSVRKAIESAKFQRLQRSV